MGDPHSLQKIRCTAWPEVPLPAQDLVGPLMVSLSLRTTATSAVVLVLVSWSCGVRGEECGVERHETRVREEGGAGAAYSR